MSPRARTSPRPVSDDPDPGPIGRALIASLRAQLAAAADPERAPRMQAYMKSTMPFRELPSPAQRRVFRPTTFVAHEPPDAASWRATMLSLWRGAEFREERYGAIALADELR